MRKIFCVLLISLFLMQVSAFAISSPEAKQLWYDAKIASSAAKETYNAAKIAYAAGKTEENKQAKIDTGKTLLNSALGEVEAWLIYKGIEVSENPGISQGLKDAIAADVETNLAKIDALRAEVNAAETELELGIVFIKMVVKYFELVTDVARNWGLAVVELSNSVLDTSNTYERQLRAAAETISENEEIISALDSAKSSLDEARSNVAKAEASYNAVVAGGTPLIKFSEGNNYTRTARANLLSAQASLSNAFALISQGG